VIGIDVRSLWLIAAAWLVAAVGMGLALPARAGEPLFGYTYTTDLLPKGKVEAEQWITLREGQAKGGVFHDIQLRSEIEYGLTNNLQISGYLNTSYIYANRNSVFGTTQGLDIAPSADPARPFSRARFDSVSAEFIWRVLSPYKDPIGLAFYIEPEIGPRERAIEFRVLAQKNFIDDRLVIAGNAFVAFEREAEDGEVRLATQLEFDAGISYRFAPRWSAGVEYRNHNEFAGHTLARSAQEHTAHFFGPNVHYASQKFYVTLAVLRQIGARGFNDEQRENIQGGLLYGDEHSRWDGIRLKFGVPFQ
jgi:hypothetical protein